MNGVSGLMTILIGQEIGEMRFKGEANSSGWNEVLDRASKQPGSTVRKNRDYS